MQYIYIYKNKLGLFQMQVIKDKAVVFNCVGTNKILEYLKEHIFLRKNCIDSYLGEELVILDNAVISLDVSALNDNKSSFMLFYRKILSDLISPKSHSLGKLDAIKITIELNKIRRICYEQLNVKKIAILKKLGVLSLASSIVVSGMLIFHVNHKTGEITTDSGEITTGSYESNSDYSYEEVVETLVEEENIDYLQVTEPETIESDVTESFEEEESYTYLMDYEEVVFSDSVKTIVTDFVDSDYGQILKELCEIFEIDMKLMIALGLQESLLNHEDYKYGYLFDTATGMFQIEMISNTPLFCTNNEGVKVYITPTAENLESFEGNAQIAIFMLKAYLEDYNNNLILALDAYNKGQGTVDIILAKLAEELNCSIDSLIQELPLELYQSNIDLLCTSPVAFVNSLSENIKNQYPNTTAYFLKWGDNSYGTDDYTKGVIWYYNGTIAVLEDYDLYKNQVY